MGRIAKQIDLEALKSAYNEYGSIKVLAKMFHKSNNGITDLLKSCGVKVKGIGNKIDLSNKTVSWETSDSSVVSVDNNGKATAKKAGNATITASVDNNVVKYNIEVTSKSIVDVPNTLASAIIFYIVGFILIACGAIVIYVKKFKTAD